MNTGQGTECVLFMMVVDEFFNIHICNAITVSQHKFITVDMRGDSPDPASGQGLHTCVNKSYFKVPMVLADNTDVSILHVQGKVVYPGSPVEKIVLDHIALVTQGNNEVVVAVVHVNLHDMPEDGVASDLNQGLRPEFRLFLHPGTFSAAQNYRLHSFWDLSKNPASIARAGLIEGDNFDTMSCMTETSQGVKPYWQREPEIMAQTAAEFRLKQEKNINDGANKLRSGEWKPFSGFGYEGMKDLEVAQLVFDEKTREEIREKVTGPLKALAEKHGVKAIFAGQEDQHPHVTLDVAKLNIPDSDVKNKIVDGLHSDVNPEAAAAGYPFPPRLSMLGEIMVGKSFKMDQLVIGAPNSYICSSEVDESQVNPRRFREAIEKIWDRVGKTLEEGQGTFGKLYASYFDIFHASAMRFTENDMNVQKMEAFLKEAYETVGEDLKKNPVTATVGSVRFVNAAEDLYKERPEWLNGAPEEWMQQQEVKRAARKTDARRQELKQRGVTV